MEVWLASFVTLKPLLAYVANFLFWLSHMPMCHNPYNGPDVLQHVIAKTKKQLLRPKDRLMKTIAMIPARYAATRFPAKLMQLLGDKPVILHTYQNTVATGLFDEVWVVTDSDIIYNAITAAGGHATKSRREHDRLPGRTTRAEWQRMGSSYFNHYGIASETT